MTSILKRLTQQLTDKNIPDAANVALRRLKEYGILDEDGNLTSYGKTRDKMTPSQRAKDRQAKRYGRDPRDFEYNAITNRARLKRA